MKKITWIGGIIFTGLAAAVLVVPRRSDGRATFTG
jgi:hypothetical protein